MFSSSLQPGSRRPSATTYREVDASTALDGATPHKLVSLLYSALAAQIAQARGALARDDVSEKGRAITHAVRIVDEGLNASLNMAAGGAIAANLHNLYEYIQHRLTLANIRNDDAPLVECAQLVETLRQGWDGIGDPLPTPARAA